MDTRMDRAAATLLASGAPLSPARIAEAARGAGVPWPALSALPVDAQHRSDVDAWLAGIAARSDAPIRCGLAERDGRVMRLAAPAAAEFHSQHGGRRVQGYLEFGFVAPVFVARAADGSLHRWAVSIAALQRGVDLPPAWTLPATVQLLATGPRGPRPVAQRVLGTGTPAAPAVGGANLFRRIERVRRRHRAGDLRVNRLLALVARRHAARVCQQGRVAHLLGSGDPQERLARAGIRARVVGEVVGRGVSAAAAFDALERSPSHELALADRRFTDVGHGRARDRSGRACVVVVLAAWPRYAGS